MVAEIVALLFLACQRRAGSTLSAVFIFIQTTNLGAVDPPRQPLPGGGSRGLQLKPAAPFGDTPVAESVNTKPKKWA